MRKVKAGITRTTFISYCNSTMKRGPKIINYFGSRPNHHFISSHNLQFVFLTFSDSVLLPSWMMMTMFYKMTRVQFSLCNESVMGLLDKCTTYFIFSLSQPFGLFPNSLMKILVFFCLAFAKFKITFFVFFLHHN